LLENSEIDIIDVRVSPIKTSPDLRKPDARRKAAGGSSVCYMTCPLLIRSSVPPAKSASGNSPSRAIHWKGQWSEVTNL